MEGCQHNTMDVEYYGPNGQMQGWYIGALQCAERMAKYMGDNEFAEKCGKLAKAAADVMDKKLFNGDFYEQIIIPPHSLDAIHKGLKSGMGTNDLEHPDAQLGKACLVDQLVGPYFMTSGRRGLRPRLQLPSDGCAAMGRKSGESSAPHNPRVACHVMPLC